MTKTNAMRILDKLNIQYEVREYDDDGEHILERGAAEKTAKMLGLAPEAVFKTIVMRTDSNEICVFCQSALNEINLKKARSAVSAGSISPVKTEELLKLTGYVRGGCSPIGMKKRFRTFIDASAENLEKICVSAGTRGVQIIVSPNDLVKACNAEITDLAL